MSNLAYKVHYTYSDYKQWQGDWELIGGEAIAMAPSPFGAHQAVVGEIIYDLKRSLEYCNKECFVYSELDYIIDEETVVRPDILLSCQKILGYAKKAPKFIVEVLSPSTAFKDQNIKFLLYEREGVEFYMMVDPALKKLRLFKLINSKYQKIGEEIEGEIVVKIDRCSFSFNLDRWWKVL